ncbi:MAG: hypothetical protein J6D47_14295 [Peptostreptococcaceae bacterium]|nr:hypothetical protein [Peptostreptococcaceae bacterium]
MRRLYRYLPPFAGDYSGVGSALYELGGMLCIHDASGCTGNYVGFDEPRSYDSEQLIYCTGLRRDDAILGNDEVYIDKIVRAAKDMNPKFIAILGSPVPLITGFDFNGVARILEQRLGIPAFGFDTAGMTGSHKEGVVMGVTKLLDYYVLPKKVELIRNEDRSCKKVNIVGATPLDISEENLEALRKLLQSRGYEVVSVLSMSNDLDEFVSFYKADVNLAITQAGALISKELEKKYDMPYLAGIPVGEYGTEHYFNCLEEVFESGKSMEVSQKSIQINGDKKGYAVVIEDGIIASSIRMELLSQGYEKVDVISIFGKDLGMSDIEVKYADNEYEIMDAINTKDCTLLAADPFLTQYREPKDGIKIIELPKYAISSKLTHQKRWVYIGNGWNKK